MLKLDIEKRKGSIFFPGDEVYLVIDSDNEYVKCDLCYGTEKVGGKTCPDCEEHQGSILRTEYAVIQDRVHALLVDQERVINVVTSNHGVGYHSIHKDTKSATVVYDQLVAAYREKYIQFNEERTEMYLKVMRVSR